MVALARREAESGLSAIRASNESDLSAAHVQAGQNPWSIVQLVKQAPPKASAEAQGNDVTGPSEVSYLQCSGPGVRLARSRGAWWKEKHPGGAGDN